MSKHDKKPQTDSFPFFIMSGVAITLVVLAFWILEPKHISKPQNLETVKNFAEFIEKKPELAENRRSKTTLRVRPQSSTPAPSIGTHSSPLRALTADERFEVSNYLQEWRKFDLPHDYHWKTQIEHTFKIAKETHDPEILAVLKRELVKIKKDKDATNRRLFENWRLEYLEIDSSPSTKIELKSEN